MRSSPSWPNGLTNSQFMLVVTLHTSGRPTVAIASQVTVSTSWCERVRMETGEARRWLGSWQVLAHYGHLIRRLRSRPADRDGRRRPANTEGTVPALYFTAVQPSRHTEGSPTGVYGLVCTWSRGVPKKCAFRSLQPLQGWGGAPPTPLRHPDTPSTPMACVEPSNLGRSQARPILGEGATHGHDTPAVRRTHRVEVVRLDGQDALDVPRAGLDDLELRSA
jgi:hypothetical protein